MANEKKDELFDINLGEDLIEIPDSNESSESGEGTTSNKKPEKTKEDVLLHDDGSFEIDDFVEEEEKASTEEEDATVIEKTEKKEDIKGKTPSKGGSSDSSPSSSSPYLAFAKDRASEGVFLNFTEDQWKELVEENEGNEAQALRELHQLSISEMIKTGVERFKESLTPEEKLLYEAKEKGLPVDKYSTAKRNYAKYSKITADQIKEDPKIAEDVVAKVLELRNFSPEEIKEEIEGYKALENLEAKALKAIEILPKAYEKEVKGIETNAAVEEEGRKDKIRQRVAKMKSLIENTPEIIPGIKLTKPVREKIMESMTTPVTTDTEGNPLNPVMATRAKNPEGFEMLIHYYHQLGLFNMDESGKIVPDFSKIAKIEKTKAVDTMRSAFESKENTTAGRAPKIKTENDEMDDFDKAFRRL